MSRPDSRGGTTQWSSGYGFLVATLGAAVGLGNIWRFSYVAGENGGGAFVLVYVVAVLALGWPLLIAELAIGRTTRADAVSAFGRISAARPWRCLGWIGVLACVGILSYYPVVAGWVANYLMVTFNCPARAARDGKKMGEKSSRDNSLMNSMPVLLRRCPDRRRCVADGVRDGSWSR